MEVAQEQDDQERLKFFEGERDKWQRQADDVRELRMNTGLQIRSKLQAFDIAIGQVAFGLAGVVGPLLLLADKIPKFPWAIYAGFLMFLTAGILAYAHHRDGISEDSHDAPRIGLDEELSMVRIRNAALKGCADPDSDKLMMEYRRISNEEVARLQARPAPIRRLTLVPDLAFGLLIVGCFLFSSQLWQGSELAYLFTLLAVVLLLCGVGVWDYISARRKQAQLQSFNDLIQKEEQDWQQWWEGFQTGRDK